MRRLCSASSVAVLAGLMLLAGCGSGDDAAPTDEPSAVQDASDAAPATTPGTTPGTTPDTPANTTAASQRFPDVVAVTLVPRDERTFDVEVTVSSPYDTPERYADGWRVLAPDGTELGSHTLAHDHANEQPFTRTQRGLTVPESITEVTIEGRDLEYGYGGGTVVVAVPEVAVPEG